MVIESLVEMSMKKCVEINISALVTPKNIKILMIDNASCKQTLFTYFVQFLLHF